MLFIDNKYTRQYYSIINNAQQYPRTGYVENHHIIPKSFFKSRSKTGWLDGNADKNNTVDLTAREHFICHLLLTKMTEGIAYKKTIYAAQRVRHGKPGTPQYVASSRIYEMLKKQWNLINPFKDPDWQKTNGIKSKGRKFTKEHRDNLKATWTADRKEAMSKANTGVFRNKTTNKGKKILKLTGASNGFYGKTHSDEFKEQERQKRLNKPAPWANKKKTCPHCLREIDLGNYKKYHGDNCKLNQQSPGAARV